MKPDLAKEIERLEKDATPGPWCIEWKDAGHGFRTAEIAEQFEDDPPCVVVPHHANPEGDAPLIVILRNHLPEIRAALALAGAVDRAEYVWADMVTEPTIRDAITAFRSTLPRSGGA